MYFYVFALEFFEKALRLQVKIVLQPEEKVLLFTNAI